MQATLYEQLSLAQHSMTSTLIGALPGLRRAARWNNLPATDQRADHIVAVLARVSDATHSC
jgi:hypothetical protein